MAINGAPNVRTYAPEQWGQIDVFSHFYAGTHEFNGDAKKAVAGVANHFQKAIILRELATKLAPNLDLDQEQLNAQGYTAAANSREFSAVVEGVFLELYSSIDCARKVVVSIYRRTRKIPDSTRKLFQRIKDRELGTDFPLPLKDAFLAATWYEELLAIRDELTHSDIGSCRLDPTSRLISYSHRGINTRGAPLEIADAFGKLDELISGINAFLGLIFNFLNLQLRPHTIDQLCGFFFGRGYMRKLPLESVIDFNTGTCQSRTWFDTESQYRCPFADACGAYARAAP
ncbi:MAG: hypothetical protein ACYDC8_07230 [Gammaproteobacteria bacterium]